MPADSSARRRFEIALSYPGEHRDYVAKVARHLATAFDEERVLYDKYHDAELARPDLDVYLPALYRKDSELVVIFLCPEYATKRWCKLEWRHIRQLIATADAGRIMFLSFGDPGDLSDLGILPGDGYIDVLKLDPEEAAAKILKRLDFNQGLSRPKLSSGDSRRGPIPVNMSRVVEYAPPKLVGRDEELEFLHDAWLKVRRGQSPRPRVLTFVALGGEGKTSLVARWAADLADRDWPGCDAAFAWSFYSQGTKEQTAASSDLFLKEALIFFGDPEAAASAQGAFDKGRRLAQLVGERQALLILDGVEPLQYAPTSPTAGELKDKGLAALLKGLAASNRGLCVVTTRYSISDLRAFWQTTAPEVPLSSLSKTAGVTLLRSLEVRGSQQEFEALVEDVKGHALTLNLIGRYLRDAHMGDIRRRDLVKLEEADAEEQGGHAFRVMDAYVRWFESEGKNGKRPLEVLRLLGLFDRPATADCVSALLKAPAIPGLTEVLSKSNEAQRNLALSRLADAKLLTVTRDTAGALVSLDAHPLLREYFARQLQTQDAEAWRAAHRRLYEHLCATTKEGDKPTLEDLQPLYQAVAHGCQAGMQQEACDDVYFARIERRNEHYSLHKLGAFGSDLGAVACFFEPPWSRVSPSLRAVDQSWLLSVAAFQLRALGRLTEALEPMRVSGEMPVKVKDWDNTAIRHGNLSELELTLGDLAGAVRDAEQSVIYADRSGNSFQRMGKLATHADALHQSGRRPEAETLFREAEALQAASQPECLVLYSLAGFRYCDLLLAPAERVAWQLTLDCAFNPHPSRLAESCQDICLRATQTLKIAERNNWLVDIGLDYLTLGRAKLFESILNGSSFEPCGFSIQHAVDVLRRAGRTDRIPRGLLDRAWLRSLTGTYIGPKSAQEDLDEAWEIAERGPMPLFLADIHLYRARLFGRRNVEGGGTKYPWESPQKDVAEARRLIEKHGYGRRQEELEDAEQALLGQPTS